MRKTILVVDDEEIIRNLFSRLFKKYRVFTAESGEEALNIIKDKSSDLVLLDLRMSGIDGQKTLRIIKSIAPHIPVIIISAYISLKVEKELLRDGAYAVIQKPFDLKKLKTMMSKVLAEKNK